jgi:predicted MFS family arabinose efflux permease
VIAVAQLMIVLDASIVNIALPSAQRDLDISDADRQWVVTAYTLAFGGLLLLGGRIADFGGRKRVFVIGLLGFAVASALGGVAGSAGLLYAARGLQGLFAALMAPAALSLISLTEYASFLTIAVVLLVAFVVWERRTAHPLLPLRVALDRNRGGSYLVFLFVGAGLFAMFLFLTFYFQATLGYSPLRSGFAFLPFSIGIIGGAGVISQLLPRLGPRPIMVPGLASAALGMLLLTQVTADTSYWTHVLPSLLLMSVGMAGVFIPASSTALVGVGTQDAGVASALLNTLYAGAVATFLADNMTAGADGRAVAADALLRGYHVAFFWGSMLLLAALVVATLLINAKNDDLPAESAVAAGQHEASVNQKRPSAGGDRHGAHQPEVVRAVGLGGLHPSVDRRHARPEVDRVEMTAGAGHGLAEPVVHLEIDIAHRGRRAPVGVAGGLQDAPRGVGSHGDVVDVAGDHVDRVLRAELCQPGRLHAARRLGLLGGRVHR